MEFPSGISVSENKFLCHPFNLSVLTQKIRGKERAHTHAHTRTRQHAHVMKANSETQTVDGDTCTSIKKKKEKNTYTLKNILGRLDKMYYKQSLDTTTVHKLQKKKKKIRVRKLYSAVTVSFIPIIVLLKRLNKTKLD